MADDDVVMTMTGMVMCVAVYSYSSYSSCQFDCRNVSRHKHTARQSGMLMPCGSSLLIVFNKWYVLQYRFTGLFYVISRAV